ncbi:MAG: hypothetical protein DYG98_26725 [Haliscomenobacteraceae bacterium CHB4]|nr:hypothetical protein [Saprospiraceae bacterium]MCE7926653.1 hypothetical protein [Haliscomenobacteraceae bacterium CHB4]
MKKHINWPRILFITGVVCLIVGAIDPLEGSVVIAFGSVLLAGITRWTHDRHRNLFLASAIMVLVGVAFLFYLSSLGGFGGDSGLSWWWGLLILPYPVAWLVTIITLIFRAVKKPK